MKAPQFQIGIKNTVTADASNNVLDLYFLDAIRNPEYYDWDSMTIEEGSLVADVISQVKYYNPSKIVCHIDSLGGDLFIAISIYNFLKDYPAKVECKIIGFCASAACVIACAANPGKLTMPYSGWFITHESSGNGITGTSAYIMQQAEIVAAQTKNMAEIFSGRNTTGKTAAEILALWVNGDCWMNGEQAQQYGFVDSCYNNTNAVVTASLKEASLIYKNIPAGTITADADEHEHKSLTEQFDDMKNELKSFVTAAIDKIRGSKVDPKSTNISAEIAEAIAQPLHDMAEQMQAEVAAERTELTATITAALTPTITADVTAAFQPKIDAQNTLIANLTADLEKLAGKQSVSGNGNGNDEKPTGRSLSGKFADA